MRLGVNIDHVATIRNARGGVHPDPVRAAQLACASGADGITVHLREDRRHISDNDIHRLKKEVDLPLNLEIAATGEMLGIAGASGVGKSTLLHILGGLDRPEIGRVLFYGEEIFSKETRDIEKFRNQKVGFVFQFFNLLSDFNALENTMFPALIARVDQKVASEQAEQLLIQVGLKDRLYHKPGELSGGESQRVALARALINKPDLLLADEPT